MQEKSIIKLQIDLDIEPKQAQRSYWKRNEKYIRLPDDPWGGGFFEEIEAVDDETSDDGNSKDEALEIESPEREATDSMRRAKPKKRKLESSGQKKAAKSAVYVLDDDDLK